MVGFLLAVNRIVRTFAYGIIVEIAARIGLKKLCLIAATTAAASTLGYTILDGAFWLSLSQLSTRVGLSVSYDYFRHIALLYFPEAGSARH